MNQPNQEAPLDAAGAAGILESAAERFAVFAAEPLKVASGSDTVNTMKVGSAIGNDLPRVLAWLRFHGHAATADRLDDALGKVVRQAAEIDMGAMQPGGVKDIMPAVKLTAAARDADTELRWAAQFIRQQIAGSQGQIKKRLSRETKLAMIAEHLKAHPNATSRQIAQATGIDAGDVRNIWGPVKRAFKEGKAYKPNGWKTEDGRVEAEDLSASCGICRAPLSGSWKCRRCNETIVGECKDCHNTDAHP